MSRSTHKPSWAKALVLALALAAGPALADPVDGVLSRVNAARAESGCRPLRLDPRLTAAAEGHAHAMAELDFFSHSGKDGSFSRRIGRQGYSYSAAAENIAAGQQSAAEVVDSWMHSKGHRHNILDCRMQDTGIALVYQPDDRPIGGNPVPLYYYWVQVFAAPK